MIELTGILQAVGATMKLKEKQKLIGGLSTTSTELLHYCCNPFKTFGVKEKSISYPPHELNASSGKEILHNFWKLADALADRTLTGDAAKKEISKVLSSYTRETAATLEKILLKDLRCHLGTTIINRVYPKLIPKFKIMLADKMDHRFKWDEGPWRVEYKYDGMRIFALVSDDGVTYLSRKGIEQPHLNGVFDDALQDIQPPASKGGWVFDGEVTGKDFQSTMKAKKSGRDTSGLIFNVFDFLYRVDWDAQKCPMPQTDRSDMLKFCFSYTDLSNTNIRLPISKICHTREEVEKFYKGLLDAGAEGVIIKHLGAPYEFKRSRAWVKYKPVWTADLEVISIYEGEGKHKGRLGGFELKGKLEDETLVVVNCGSGFTDEMREEFWNDGVHEGAIVEVEYQEVTQDQHGGTHSLRFPIFKKFRKDK